MPPNLPNAALAASWKTWCMRRGCLPLIAFYVILPSIKSPIAVKWTRLSTLNHVWLKRRHRERAPAENPDRAPAQNGPLSCKTKRTYLSSPCRSCHRYQGKGYKLRYSFRMEFLKRIQIVPHLSEAGSSTPVASPAGCFINQRRLPWLIKFASNIAQFDTTPSVPSV